MLRTIIFLVLFAAAAGLGVYIIGTLLGTVAAIVANILLLPISWYVGARWAKYAYSRRN